MSDLKTMGFQEAISSLQAEVSRLRAELYAAYQVIPDTLNRDLPTRIQGLLDRANREAALACQFNAEVERLREALRRAAEELWIVKQVTMQYRDSAELSPLAEDWIVAKIEALSAGAGTESDVQKGETK
jgi:hypothetical protein